MTGPSERSGAERVRDATTRLAAPAEPAPNIDPVTALAVVCQKLRTDPALVHAIHEQSGLTKPVVQLGLDTTLAPLDPAYLSELRELALRAPPLGSKGAPDPKGPAGSPIDRAFVNLAGNVFSASAAPLIVASLLRVPVLLRTSVRDDVFPLALAAAINASMVSRIEALTFDHQDDEAFLAAFERADVSELFGSDETVIRLVELAPWSTDRSDGSTGCGFIKRGHGMGAVLLGQNVRAEEYALLAEDVAAYDQQGCLSPRIVYAEGSLDAHAIHLSNALGAIESRLPRGQLPNDVAIASSQWRASAAALGTLHEGPTHALVVDPTGIFPLGPTHRHLVVRSLAPECLQPHRQHLKVIGHTNLGRRVLDLVPGAVSMTFCPPGQMQRPDMRNGADGYWVGQGYVRVAKN